MEVKLVRFSRPLLLRVDNYKDDYLYQTIFGFWLPDDMDFTPVILKQYVNYLCGIHDWSSGGNFFSVNNEWSGFFEWVDKRGFTHVSNDKWRKDVGEKCRRKLNLTYNVIKVEVDEDYFLNQCLNEEKMIVNEEFYYDLERFLDDDHLI